MVIEYLLDRLELRERFLKLISGILISLICIVKIVG